MRIKVNGIYYVTNRTLNIRGRSNNYLPGGHSVIVTSINRKRGTARVKTITSVVNHENVNEFNNRKLNDVSSGNLLIIPIRSLNSRHLSAVNHKSITVKLDKLYESHSRLKYPKRYDRLIHRK